jgi:hypothetical protein
MCYILLVILILGTTLPQHAPQEQHLEFVLSAEKSTYLAYEPLVLEMTIINKGQQPVQGDFDRLNLACKELKLYDRKEGGEFKRYYNVLIWFALGKDWIRLGPKPTLDPGGRVSTREMVLFDTLPGSIENDKFVLSEPGNYEFKATLHYVYEDWSKIIESNVLRLTVTTPPEAEQEALGLWKHKDLALVVQGDDASAETIGKLRLLLQKFPNSLYATAVRASSERLKSYLSQKAKEKKLTEDGKELYERLHPNN